MAKAVWVDDLIGDSSLERTSRLESFLRQNGYKLTDRQFQDLLHRNGADKLADYFKLRRIMVGPMPKGNGGLAYGIMKLDDKYSFYISNLKLTPDGFPEFRVVIESEKEFDSWLSGFIQVAKSQIIPFIDDMRVGT